MSKPFIELAEEVAIEGLKAIKAYLAYQGENKMYEKHAKAGAAAVQGFTRHYASQTNREIWKMSVEKRELPMTRQKALPRGN